MPRPPRPDHSAGVLAPDTPAPGSPAMAGAPADPPPGVPGGMPAAWLRDNCPCAQCRDPVSGQRLLDITRLPAGLAVAAVTAHPDRVEVVFDPDGHRAVFDRAWLDRWSRGPDPRHGDDPRTEDAKRLWPVDGRAEQAAPASWPRYLADAAYRRTCQQAILREGLLLLAGVPEEPGTVLEVAASMGYVRETNYGRLFDVRAGEPAANLAYTRLPIAPHTDNPYRDPVPTVQLLHCLENSADGGDSLFTDGFRAAAQLREQDPASFATLAVTPVTFCYRAPGTWLRATRPMITLDPRGRIREIRFNSRSLQPARLRPAQAAAFYTAYRAFAGLLANPAWTRPVRLAPGDCAVFDNTRVLHARTGFGGTGRRHLQGCYADLDGIESAVAATGTWPDARTAEGRT